MTTLELFITTIILTLAIGIIVGGLAMEVLVVRPLRARHAREHQRVLNAFRQGTGHLGTPYIRRLSDTAAGNVTGAGLLDDHNGSRKAPDADVISLPAPRVQTGRPV